MGLTQHLPSELWTREQVFARSIAAKLWEFGRSELSAPLEICHTEATYCHCLSCNQALTWWNRCDRFYCPMCVSRLAYRRRLSVQAWADQVDQPKHIVLTVRNTHNLTNEYVKWFKNSLGRLRRKKTPYQWRGGLASLEVTNEQRGWHLHCHLLVDTEWVDTTWLSLSWGKIVGQAFAIVAVKDCRDRTYLGEVTKYAVKGCDLAAWKGYEIAQFIDAMTGVRQFGVFGSLFKDRIKRQKVLDKLAKPDFCCPQCDSDNLWLLDQNEHDWFETSGKITGRPLRSRTYEPTHN